MEAYRDLLSSLKEVAKSSNVISSQDIHFHRSLDPEVASILDRCNEQLLNFTSNLVRLSNDRNMQLEDGDDVNESWNDISETTDTLLEKADMLLDEYTGAVKKQKLHHSSATLPTVSPKSSRGKLAYKLIHAENIARPQLKFKQAPDNSSTIFTPRLTNKPNALRSLEDSLKMDASSQILSFPHPYDHEIKHSTYPRDTFKRREPQQVPFLHKSDAIWVDSKESLDMMFEELRRSHEIAVDLEHHDYRSYQGFVCLMQISNRDKDWVVDSLALREELQVLNSVFTDPSIIKVFHGAYMDIKWLQRDFGLYIVGLFDTFHASKRLQLAGHGLSFLLQHYANFEAQKKYQLADWRIRPLPQEMLDYARSDTHFLLFIFDHLINELLDVSEAALEDVLDLSREVALQRFEKSRYDAEQGLDPNGWRTILMKFNIRFSHPAKQIPVFKALHFWRDQMARHEDESVRYVLPNHMLIAIANVMPKGIAGVLGACNPVPPLVKLYASDIVDVVNRAKQDETAVMEQASGIDDHKEETQLTSIVGESQRQTAGDRQNVPEHRSFFQGDQNTGLKTSLSEFWKENDDRAKEGAEHAKRILKGMNLSIPLPELSAAIYHQAPEAEKSPSTADPGALAHHHYTGTKRNEFPKVDSEQDGDLVQLKRARNGKSSLGKSTPATSKMEGDAEQPVFDYANAPPVMRSKHQIMEESKGSSFDPYGKINDDAFKQGQNGLKRVKRAPVAGRSQTFSSM